jgi:hypothetical protein
MLFEACVYYIELMLLEEGEKDNGGEEIRILG